MSRPPRLPGFDYRGPNRYFLTFCTHSRKPLFEDPGVVSRTMLQIRRTSRDGGFALLAYCLMPDHAHFLVEGLETRSDLRRFVALAKQRSGMSHRRAGGAVLWQEGYYDRILREGDDARHVARYILGNPVRAGLVRRVVDYPYLGSDVWSVQELLESVVL